MKKALFFFLIFLSLVERGYSLDNDAGDLPNDAPSVAFNLLQYIDLADLEYDDSPYPGRTNLGHVIIPSLCIQMGIMQLVTGGWYRHVYVHYDEDDSPHRLYPYIAVQLTPQANTEIRLGNFENLFPFPNSIYNEFLFFEERPVCSGVKISYMSRNAKLLGYIDWVELDTEEHPEEFLTGIILEHHPFAHVYYTLFNHYHHRGGQLHKDTHPVRLEQDVVTSPLLGFSAWKIFLEFRYYWSIFEQNFKSAIYGHAGDVNLGFRFTDRLTVSYLCWYNYNYYHQDAHIFYNKRKNVLHRARMEYNIFSYRRIADFFFTVNLYGPDPPGVDFRIFGTIDIDFYRYETRPDDETI